MSFEFDKIIKNSIPVQPDYLSIAALQVAVSSLVSVLDQKYPGVARDFLEEMDRLVIKNEGTQSQVALASLSKMVNLSLKTPES